MSLKISKSALSTILLQFASPWGRSEHVFCGVGMSVGTSVGTTVDVGMTVFWMSGVGIRVGEGALGLLVGVGPTAERQVVVLLVPVRTVVQQVTIHPVDPQKSVLHTVVLVPAAVGVQAAVAGQHT